MREATMLLGRDHGAFGALTLHAQAGGRTACAISVGSDAPDGVRIFKGDLEIPNEDAVLVVDEGQLTMLAVCDGHHGHEASHHLIEALAANAVPRDPLALLALLARLSADPDLNAEAATTLLISIVDRAR